MRCSRAHVFPEVKYTKSRGEDPEVRERRESERTLLSFFLSDARFSPSFSFSLPFLFLCHLRRLPSFSDNCRSAEFISRNLRVALALVSEIFLCEAPDSMTFQLKWIARKISILRKKEILKCYELLLNVMMHIVPFNNIMKLIIDRTIKLMRYWRKKLKKIIVRIREIIFFNKTDRKENWCSFQVWTREVDSSKLLVSFFLIQTQTNYFDIDDWRDR